MFVYMVFFLVTIFHLGFLSNSPPPPNRAQNLVDDVDCDVVGCCGVGVLSSDFTFLFCRTLYIFFYCESWKGEFLLWGITKNYYRARRSKSGQKNTHVLTSSGPQKGTFLEFFKVVLELFRNCLGYASVYGYA